MQNLEQTVETSFFNGFRKNLSRIRNSVAGKIAVYSLAGILGAGLGYGCGGDKAIAPKNDVVSETYETEASEVYQGDSKDIPNVSEAGKDVYPSDDYQEGEPVKDFGNDEIAEDVEKNEAFENIDGAEIPIDIFEKEILCIPTNEYEICGNKIDDNCNGETDEDYTGKTCWLGIGECEESGNEICFGKGITACDAEPKLPSNEICDGWDNDCDGETDENLIGCCISKTEQDCGLNIGECKFGKKTCLEDGSWSECIGGVLPYSEICDGKDNNCNGKTDETYLYLGNVCEVGKGECKVSGKMVCSQDGKLVVCDAMPGNGPSDEICDGKDNDCDGKTDEDWSKLGNGCVTGIGKCAIMGKIVCSEDGKDTICFAKNQPQPSEEICDGIDDDCDGCDDFCEFPELYTQCFVGLGECRTEGIIVCDEKFTPTKCSVSAIGNEVPLPKPEVCDGKDNDCDGEVDEGCVVYLDKTFGGSKDDFAFSIQQTKDLGYIAAGITKSKGTGKNDAWVFKLDSNGNLVWDKTFGGSGNDWVRSIQQTKDGGYIVAGYTKSKGAGEDDAWVFKLDSNGNLVWDKTFGGSGNDRANLIQQTADLGYIVAGMTKSKGAGEKDAWVFKLDADGNLGCK